MPLSHHMPTSDDLYAFLRTKAKNRVLQISVQQLAGNLGLTKKQVRTRVATLVRDGYVTVRKTNGRDLGPERNIYTLTDKEPPSGIDLMKVKMAYCEYAGQRANRKFNPRYSFVGYTAQFSRIADICKANQFEPLLYVVACFHVMPEKWCTKTFKVPYPPPFTLSNKRLALERYDTLIRFINQHMEVKVTDKKKTQIRADEEQTWRSLGKPTDPSTLNVLVTAGTLSKEFVTSLKISEAK